MATGGPSNGAMIGAGELLVSPPFLPYFLGSGTHDLSLPNDPSLLGRVFATQGATLAGGVLQLTNALDLTLGDQ